MNYALDSQQIEDITDTTEDSDEESKKEQDKEISLLRYILSITDLSSNLFQTLHSFGTKPTTGFYDILIPPPDSL